MEEAHNLLKNTASGGESDLVGKSVEMLTQTIAEIRTYGEGFIIVDQSPSSVDIAAIKNTNTKIVLRTPEANDREAVGRSMGLTEDQVNEIAKLPSGVAVVYQNNWVSPILTLVDKADVKETPYMNPNPEPIKPMRVARTEILSMLMQPWFERERISGKVLKQDLQALEIDRALKRMISDCITDYVFCGGKQIWRVEDIPKLQVIIKGVLGITDSEVERIVMSGNPDDLRTTVQKKASLLTLAEVEEVCNVLTMVEGESDNEP